MIQTYRCRLCGQVLEAFIEFAPGIPLALSQQTVQSKVQAAQVRHADQCPGPRERRTRPKPLESPAPERPARTRQHQGILANVLGLVDVWRRGSLADQSGPRSPDG